jgi:uncharacterized protein YsxB (DUF464 family)
MIQAKFYESKGILTGFSFSGHSGYAEAGKDVACAAVSSAVQLTANMLEEFGYSPDVKVGDNIIECSVAPNKDAARMLEQLRLHFEAILEEFPNTINITISEV